MQKKRQPKDVIFKGVKLIDATYVEFYYFEKSNISLSFGFVVETKFICFHGSLRVFFSSAHSLSLSLSSFRMLFDTVNYSWFVILLYDSFPCLTFRRQAKAHSTGCCIEMQIEMIPIAGENNQNVPQ